MTELNLPKKKTLQLKYKVALTNSVALDHPRCLRVKDAFKDGDQKVILVSDFIGQTESDLCNFVAARKYICEHDLGAITDQLLSVLEYAHKNKMILKNLRPTDIIFESGFVENEEISLIVQNVPILKYLDNSNGEQSDRMLFDQMFLAPELYTDSDENEVPLDVRNDTYSLGAILYFLVTGGVQDDRQTPISIYSFNEESWEHFSVELKDFVKQCLTHDVKDRPIASKLASHPFIGCYRADKLSRLPVNQDVAESMLQFLHADQMS